MKRKKEMVYKSTKCLHELKQSSRMWYQKFDTCTLRLCFSRSKVDHCLYSKQVSDNFINVILNVDDMLLIENNNEIFKDVKAQFSSKFDTIDIRAANLILGM